MTYFDALFWSRHFESVYAKQIIAFTDAVMDRLLPQFDNLEAEADQAADREYDRLGELPVGPDGPMLDMGECADMANDAGHSYYGMMTSVRQSLLNLSVAALYHMWEQQMMLFHRKQVLSTAEEDERKLLTFDEMKKRLAKGGVVLSRLPAWPKVEELGHLANTIKHGEGRAAESLRSLRPEMFFRDSVRGMGWDTFPGKSSVYQPLMGDDVYATAEDLQAYRTTLLGFWAQFSQAIVDAERS